MTNNRLPRYLLDLVFIVAIGILATLAIVARARGEQAPVPPLGFALNVGAFYQFSDRYGDDPTLVGNAAIVVEGNGVARRSGRPAIVPWYLIAETPTVAAVFIHGSDVDSMNAEAVALQREPTVTNYPILGYIDRGDWLTCPTAADWIGVQAYRRAGESLDAFDRRIRAMIRSCIAAGRFVALIVQTYDTNDGLARDVSPQFQYYFAWVQDFRPNVRALLAFSDGRALDDGSRGGLRAHPRWRDQWTALVGALTGIRPKMPNAPTNLRTIPPTAFPL